MTSIDAGTVGLITTVFIASAVECVEAFTIVLAMGMTRNWKSTIVGSMLALAALSILVALAGVSIRTAISESLLQLIIGSLLLIFGLQWMRKAILRSGGIKAFHDEEKIYRKQLEDAKKAGSEKRFGLDWFAFVVSLKGVFLEGLEVIFIVITFGLSASIKNPNSMFIASMGALAAFVVVVIAGVIAKGPLSAVPENTLKFAVAALLCTFGTYWGAEGLGFFSINKESLEWPGGDLSIIAVLAVWIIVAWMCVKVVRTVIAKNNPVSNGDAPAK
jgi:Ca2+/H+ antiporter, TMEM165/GDT1 family